MLCASVLAELEKATAVGQERCAAPRGKDVNSEDDDGSVVSSNVESITASEGTGTNESTTPTVLADPEHYVVGQSRDFSGHADGTTNAYNSVEKWIVAALKLHGKAIADLVRLPSYDPNDSLCADVHSTIADWHTTRTTGHDAGIVDSRPFALERTPPQDCLVKTRGWLARYVNQRGAEQKVSLLLERWARNLACVKADARQVNKTTKQVKAASGTLYHHKHDMAPTQEQLNSMTCIGFSGDQRCHANTLDALEAGMAIGLYRCSWKHSRRCTCSPLAMRRLKTRRVALRSNVSR